MAAPAASLIDGQKACSACGIVKPLDAFRRHPTGLGGRRSECRECANVQMREWRKNNRELVLAQKQRSWDRNKDRWNAERRTAEKREQANAVRRRARAEGRRRPYSPDPQKAYARFLVWKATSSGVLTRGCCESCGTDQNVQAHHEDYSKPLDVTWLCARCHTALHREEAV